jgi:hypothetical protein
VEECKSVSTPFLKENHFFDGGIRWGNICWTRRGKKSGNMEIWVSTSKDDQFIRFQYTCIHNRTGEETEHCYRTGLVSTPCHFGKRRWWFLCPQAVNDGICNRRAAVLYIDPSGRHGYRFGCRHCLNLTYRSTKENWRWRKFFEKYAMVDAIDPEKAMETFKKIRKRVYEHDF